MKRSPEIILAWATIGVATALIIYVVARLVG